MDHRFLFVELSGPLETYEHEKCLPISHESMTGCLIDRSFRATACIGFPDTVHLCCSLDVHASGLAACSMLQKCCVYLLWVPLWLCQGVHVTQEALPPLPAPLEMAFSPAPELVSAAPVLAIPTLPKVRFTFFYTSSVYRSK